LIKSRTNLWHTSNPLDSPVSSTGPFGYPPLEGVKGEVFDFIADFMCKELRLVIEVDGTSPSPSLEKRGAKVLKSMTLGKSRQYASPLGRMV
jgi:hypothetical protein